MLGLAILEGFETIGLWGIELMIGTEYFYQRMCVEYLIGFAKAKGIEIILPEGCTILYQQNPYGECSEAIPFPFTAQEISDRLKMHTEARDQAEIEFNARVAAIAELSYWARLYDQRTKLQSVHTQVGG